MKKLKKWTAMAVSACLTAGLLAGCGGTGETGGQDTPGQPEESEQSSQEESGGHLRIPRHPATPTMESAATRRWWTER